MLGPEHIETLNSTSSLARSISHPESARGRCGLQFTSTYRRPCGPTGPLLATKVYLGAGWTLGGRHSDLSRLGAYADYSRRTDPRGWWVTPTPPHSQRP